jgi:hypothetical protein
MRLAVLLTLECGHTKEGFAYGKSRRIPRKIFCVECHRAAAEKKPKAPRRAHARARRRLNNPTHRQVVKRAVQKAEENAEN